MNIKPCLRGVLANVAFITLSIPSIGHSNEPTTHLIEISQFRFVPDNLSVQPGDTIIWTNRDVVPHKATAIDESWDTGALKTGNSGSVLVTEDFSLRYFCPYHPTTAKRFPIKRQYNTI